MSLGARKPNGLNTKTGWLKLTKVTFSCRIMTLVGVYVVNELKVPN
jgi:hypothetical protein